MSHLIKTYIINLGTEHIPKSKVLQDVILWKQWDEFLPLLFKDVNIFFPTVSLYYLITFLPLCNTSIYIELLCFIELLKTFLLFSEKTGMETHLLPSFPIV